MSDINNIKSKLDTDNQKGIISEKEFNDNFGKLNKEDYKKISEGLEVKDQQFLILLQKPILENLQKKDLLNKQSLSVNDLKVIKLFFMSYGINSNRLGELEKSNDQKMAEIYMNEKGIFAGLGQDGWNEFKKGFKGNLFNTTKQGKDINYPAGPIDINHTDIKWLNTEGLQITQQIEQANRNMQNNIQQNMKNIEKKEIATRPLSQKLEELKNKNTLDALDELISVPDGILYADNIKELTENEKQKIQKIIENVFSNPSINSSQVMDYVWNFYCSLSDEKWSNKTGKKIEGSNLGILVDNQVGMRVEIINTCYQLAQAKGFGELQSNPENAKINLVKLCKILTGRFNSTGKGRMMQEDNDKKFNNPELAKNILENLMQINGTIDKISPADLLKDEPTLKNRESGSFVAEISQNIPRPLSGEFGILDLVSVDEKTKISDLSLTLQARSVVLLKISQKIKSDGKQVPFENSYIQELKTFGINLAKTQQSKFENQKEKFKEEIKKAGWYTTSGFEKSALEYGLQGADIDIFNLYRDFAVNNLGAGQLSDEVDDQIMGYAKMGYMIGGTIMTMMIFPPAGVGYLGSAIAVGVTQGILTQALYKKMSYENFTEGAVDIGSQFVFDTATAFLGMKVFGPIVQKVPGFWNNVKNITSNVGVTLFDASIGAGVEGIRQIAINELFDKQEKVDILQMIRAGGVMATVFLMVSGGFHAKLPVDDMLIHLKANDPKINPSGFKNLKISEIDYQNSVKLLELKSKAISEKAINKIGKNNESIEKDNIQKNDKKTSYEEIKKQYNESQKNILELGKLKKEGKISAEEYMSKVKEIENNAPKLDDINKAKYNEIIKKYGYDISKEKIQNYINKLGANIQGGGSNARGVHIIEGTNLVAVIKSEGSFMYELPQRNIMLTYNNPRVPKVIDVFVYEGKTYKIMEKSPGKSVETLLPEEIANIPQEHYDNYIRDIKEIENAGLQVDPSKASNVFYDKESGFHFIDLGIRESSASMFDNPKDLQLGKGFLDGSKIEVARESSNHEKILYKVYQTIFSEVSNNTKHTFETVELNGCTAATALITNKEGKIFSLSTHFPPISNFSEKQLLQIHELLQKNKSKIGDIVSIELFGVTDIARKNNDYQCIVDAIQEETAIAPTKHLSEYNSRNKTRASSENLGKMDVTIDGKGNITFNHEGKLINIQKTIRTDLETKKLEGVIIQEKTELMEITEEYFKNIEGKESEINNLLQEVLDNTNYNTTEKVFKLMELYETNKVKNQDYTMKDAFNDLKLDKVNQEEGTNCEGMSKLLQEKLKGIGVESYLIGFKSGLTLDDNYIPMSHAALVIPRIINGKKYFTLLDPGLIVRKPITFCADGTKIEVEMGNDKTYSVEKKSDPDFPFVMNNPKGKSLEFNPYKARTNTEKTLNKDILRIIPDYKRAKLDGEGNIIALLRVNIDKETVDVRFGSVQNTKSLPFKDFVSEVKNNPEFKKDIEKLTKALTGSESNTPDLITKIENVIKNIDEYKSDIMTYDAFIKSKETKDISQSKELIKGNNLTEKIDYLYEKSKEAKKEADKIVNEVGKESVAITEENGPITKNFKSGIANAPIKGKQRVLEKIEEYKQEVIDDINSGKLKIPEGVYLSEFIENEAISRNKDIVRSSLIYETKEGVLNGLYQFIRHNSVKNYKFKDRLHIPGVRDILMTYQLPNGYVCEIQFHVREFIKAKENGYKLTKSEIDFENFFNEKDKQTLGVLKEIKTEDITTKKKNGLLDEKDYNKSKENIEKWGRPKNNEEIASGHDYYDIIRSIPEKIPKSMVKEGVIEVDYKNLKEKLIETQKILDAKANSLYEKKNNPQ